VAPLDVPLAVPPELPPVDVPPEELAPEEDVDVPLPPLLLPPEPPEEVVVGLVASAPPSPEPPGIVEEPCELQPTKARVARDTSAPSAPSAHDRVVDGR
jgi:hypothetical protein